MSTTLAVPLPYKFAAYCDDCQRQSPATNDPETLPTRCPRCESKGH